MKGSTVIDTGDDATDAVFRGDIAHNDGTVVLNVHGDANTRARLTGTSTHIDVFDDNNTTTANVQVTQVVHIDQTTYNTLVANGNATADKLYLIRA